MLSTLRIKNLALVTELTLTLREGYNAVTGETGAGKSVIIGALSLLMGERADRNLIRSGCDSCSVEAVFEQHTPAPAVIALLEENGLDACADNQLLLKRVFTAAGANRQFVNGSPTTLQVLSRLGKELVDMHGPHDHQSLLDPLRQRDILDAFAGAGPLRAKFAEIAGRRRSLQAEKESLVIDDRTYAQQLDLLRFQVNEISAAKLNAGEEADLGQDLKRAGNAARLLELSQAALDLLAERENSLLTQSAELGRLVQSLHQLDGSAAGLAENQEQSAAALRDLQAELRHYSEKLDVDPSRLKELEERMDLVHSLKRKYGATLEEVIAFGEDARAKLLKLEQREGEVIRLDAEIAKCRAEQLEIGRELSAQRRKAIPKLSKAANKQLADLGLANSRFEAAMRTDEEGKSPSSAGFDEVEFQFAANAGEPPRPLRLIASSGEMSRLMLALKTVLAGEDQIPVLVFDEIDSNVGGETAAVVGRKMSQIAREHQVICITHLPPVAASAKSHFVVTKRVEAGRTISDITLLDRSGRVHEIARMLGGQSETARKHAEKLLDASTGED
jgi:DNA repair protein RecN (Recombination protein N)